MDNKSGNEPESKLQHPPIPDEVSENANDGVSGEESEISKKSNVASVLGRDDLDHGGVEAEGGDKADSHREQPPAGVGHVVGCKRPSEVAQGRQCEAEHIGL